MDNKKKIKIQEKLIGIKSLDLKIAIAISICCLTSAVLRNLGIMFAYNGMNMEIIQSMTASISCLLCCQEDTKISFKAGINRLIITAIGGAVGIVVILLDNILGNEWIKIILVVIGILLTLLLCKIAKVPYINARIGGVTFILVTYTFSGNVRIWYALFRFVSTSYGVLIVMMITWVFQYLTAKKEIRTKEAG